MIEKLSAAALFALSIFSVEAQQTRPIARSHNVVIFVADGLRYGSVESRNMPNMARLKSVGVDFTNSHSLYPTVTTANASVIATGHYVGDTGNFGNTLYVGQPMATVGGSTLAILANNRILDEMNRKFGGNYLNETTLMAAALAKGWQTAVIGEESPSRIQDPIAPPDQAIILDDSTGHNSGLALPDWLRAEMKQAPNDNVAPKVAVPDIEQEAWMAKIATSIVLPHFKNSGKPFILLFWSRDPDISQHLNKDSVGNLVPGINGPTSKVALRNADTALGALLSTLKQLGLDTTTDVFVTADHGFTTVSHDDNGRNLPFGFLATDLAKELNLPISQQSFLGTDPANPEVVVARNGGSDLLYLPSSNARTLAGSIIKFLTSQSYVSGIFVNDALGRYPGALPMSDVGLIGAAQTPQPSIYVNFHSFSACEEALQCAVSTSDTPFSTGQGDHGGFSRAETRNLMAAIGPDFKKGYTDTSPVSNADIAPTLAHIMGLDMPAKGKLVGRVISEALKGGAPVRSERHVIASAPVPNGMRTILDEQSVGDTHYFDAAGFEGRTVGLDAY